MHHSLSALDQVHIMLSLVIMAGYLTVPLTALRKIPLPRVTQIAGLLFFATCALTHIAMAFGFAYSNWFVLNDAVQAIAVIVFIYTLNKMVGDFFDASAVRKAEANRMARSD